MSTEEFNHATGLTSPSEQEEMERKAQAQATEDASVNWHVLGASANAWAGIICHFLASLKTVFTKGYFDKRHTEEAAFLADTTWGRDGTINSLIRTETDRDTMVAQSTSSPLEDEHKGAYADASRHARNEFNENISREGGNPNDFTFDPTKYNA